MDKEKIKRLNFSDIDEAVKVFVSMGIISEDKVASVIKDCADFRDPSKHLSCASKGKHFNTRKNIDVVRIIASEISAKCRVARELLVHAEIGDSGNVKIPNHVKMPEGARREFADFDECFWHVFKEMQQAINPTCQDYNPQSEIKRMKQIREN